MKCKVKDSCKNTSIMMLLGGGLIKVEVRSLGKGKFEFTDPIVIFHQIINLSRDNESLTAHKVRFIYYTIV